MNEKVETGSDAEVEPEGHATAEAQDSPVYWCVACGRALVGEVNEGGSLFVHDDVPHPAGMTYDEEERPQ